MNKELLEYFDINGYTNIKQTGSTWAEIGSKFNLSEDAARKQMARIWNSRKNEDIESNLELKSKWEVLGKGGEVVTLRSFKAPESNDNLSLDDIDAVCKKYAVSSPKPFTLLSWNITPKRQVLSLGDIHVGMACDDNIFNLRWNREELFLRADTFIKSVDTSCDYLTLIFGGDICDGQAGKTTRGLKGSSHHILPQNLSDREQIDVACEFITYVLDGITAITKATIDVVYLTNSNHGGILDYAVGKVMEATCLPRYGGQVFWENQLEFLSTYTIGKYNFILTHGYDEQHMNRGWSRFLSKDNEQFVDRYILKNVRNNYANILLRFDQHQSTNIRYVGFNDIVCPAFSNPSSWVSLNFGTDYKGGFLSLIISDERIQSEVVEF